MVSCFNTMNQSSVLGRLSTSDVYVHQDMHNYEPYAKKFSLRQSSIETQESGNVLSNLFTILNHLLLQFFLLVSDTFRVIHSP